MLFGEIIDPEFCLETGWRLWMLPTPDTENVDCDRFVNLAFFLTILMALN